MTPEDRMAAYRRALQPAGGTVTDDELRALGAWAQPAREHRSAWAARVRQLLAESPLRDLASAAIEARAEVGRGMAAAARRRPQDARSERGRGEVAARRSRGSEGRGGRSAPQIAKGWPSCLPASTFSTPAAKTRS